MRHTITVSALTAALLVSTAAYAQTASVGADASISALPDSGTVSLTGTVERVSNDTKFILRDAAGETIDVHTESKLSVKEGDMVSVKGEKTSEIAGIGNEIEKATVTVTDKASASAQATTQMRAENESPAEARNNTEAKKTAAYDADIDVDADGDVAKTAEARTVNSDDKPANARDKNNRTTAAYDADVDVDVDGDVKQVAEAGEMTAAEATAAGTAKANATANAVAGKATSATAALNDTIEALPKEGSVELNGVVDRVSNDTKFILRDASGKTIDVHTASTADVKAGDTVSVNGDMKSELLGFGRKIENAKVLELSASAQ